jgi:glycosyltransferase involved in cell wall biosynthesis
VFDGASADATVDILRSYGDKLQWVSEKDRGQSHAINKGISRSTGDVIAWINSNDAYLPNAFETVGNFFIQHPEIDMVYGRALLIDESDKLLGEYPQGLTPEELCALNSIPHGHYKALLNHNAGLIPQQSVFWRKSIMDKAGLLDEKLHYAMDYEYWLRLGKIGNIYFINKQLASYRMHYDAKTVNARKHWKEILLVNMRYGGRIFSGVHKRFLRIVFLAIAKRIKLLQRSKEK